MRLYSDLAPWYPLVSRREDYAEEADHLLRLIEAAREGPADTLLELGCGAGHMASHLSARFACTLTDASAAMLVLSRTINPSCAHVEGDMRTLRLERTFDVVLAHDAIGYMATESDLAAALHTAAVHLRPGGLAVVVPDDVAETFRAGTETGGYATGTRSLHYLEWSHDPNPRDTSITVEYVFTLRDGPGSARIETDTHVLGLFPRATWRRLMEGAGLAVLDVTVPDPFAEEHAVFVGRKVPI